MHTKVKEYSQQTLSKMITEGLTCLLKYPVANASNQALQYTYPKPYFSHRPWKNKIKSSYMAVKATMDINMF